MGLLNKAFFKIGFYSASNPGAACFCAIMLTLVCSLGFINYRVTVSIHKYNHKILNLRNLIE